MDTFIEKRFKKDIGALESIYVYVQNYIDANGIDNRSSYAIQLAIEEIFSNCVKYSRGGESTISINLSRKKDSIIIVLTEFNAEPFDVTSHPDADITVPLEKREVGGLGLHLVRHMIDEIKYEYKNKNSIITLIKHLEEPDV
ncbi:MAG: ATP-binding protein [Candidatus Zixiibacteriota bacterium]|nr:MAG: ATP-binding protein [candidate division Zixibacteria bacterium]